MPSKWCNGAPLAAEGACAELEDRSDPGELHARTHDPESRFSTCIEKVSAADGEYQSTIDGVKTTVEVDRCAGLVRMRRGKGMHAYTVMWRIASFRTWPVH